jgi:hypothetical protein
VLVRTNAGAINFMEEIAMGYSKNDFLIRTIVFVVVLSVVYGISIANGASYKEGLAYLWFSMSLLGITEVILLRIGIVKFGDVWGWSILGKILDSGGYLCWSFYFANLANNRYKTISIGIFFLGVILMILSFFISRKEIRKNREV